MLNQSSNNYRLNEVSHAPPVPSLFNQIPRNPHHYDPTHQSSSDSSDNCYFDEFSEEKGLSSAGDEQEGSNDYFPEQASPLPVYENIVN